MKRQYVNIGGSIFTKENLKIISEKYNAKYVADLCVKTKNNTRWSFDPVAIFYQENPPNENYSNYFAIFKSHGQIYITDGSSAVEGEINGLMSKKGEIIFSRYCHDMRSCKTDDSVWVDGGRDYFRRSMNGTPVTLTVVNGEFIVKKIGE